MKNINNTVFLSKIAQRVKNGDFDVYLTLPFMTRDLFLYSVKGHLSKKLSTGGTPILSDNELKDCIEEVKETALTIIKIYMKLGFIIRTEDGYAFTDKMSLAIRAAYGS